jgi:xylan 1,4-beta-xylosidase
MKLPLVSAIAVALLAGCSTPSQPARYSNPVILGDHADPSVIRVGKTFWATATSSEWGPQFPLLRSTDLVNWENTGPVFNKRPEWSVANYWAPEISHWGSRYYVFYTGRKPDGPLALAVASADKPEGPYTDHGPLVAQDAGSIDGMLIGDEQGTPYLVWKEDGNSRGKPTPIWAQPFDPAVNKLVGEPREILRNDVPWEGNLVEGPFILKRGEWFYAFYSGAGCCGSGCTYGLGVARSKTLLGPWEKNPANPILAGNDAWRCPGHGSIVDDGSGRYWLLYHAYAQDTFVYTGREALLDEVVFNDPGWPTINGGKGPSSTAASPFGQKQHRTELAYSDSFSNRRLDRGWQWPVDAEPVVKLDPSGGGRLRLSPASDQNQAEVGAVLGRSLVTGDFTATTILRTTGLAPGTRAGLAAIGDRGNAVGLALGHGQVLLWQRERGQTKTVESRPAPSGERLFIRALATSGHLFHFSYSSDGTAWTGIGHGLNGGYLPPWDRSVRIGLTVGGGPLAVGDFESFNIVPQNRRGDFNPSETP